MTTRLDGHKTRTSCPSTGATARAPATRTTPAATRPPTCGRRSGSGTASWTSWRASSTCRSRRRSVGGKKIRKETMIFPRYHQLDCRAEARGRRPQAAAPAHNYLIQHSAGSGKSNSIAWLAHRLASLHDDAGREGLRLGHRHHRPRRPRPAAAGHDLPVRAQAGRGAEDRRELRRSLPRPCQAARPSSSRRCRSSRS